MQARTPQQILIEINRHLNRYEEHYANLHAVFLSVHAEKAISIYKKALEDLQQNIDPAFLNHDAILINQIDHIRMKLNTEYKFLDSYYQKVAEGLSAAGRISEGYAEHKKSLKYACKAVETESNADEKYRALYATAVRHKNFVDIINSDPESHDEAVALAQTGLELSNQLAEIYNNMGPSWEVENFLRWADLQRGFNAVIAPRQASAEEEEKKYDDSYDEAMEHKYDEVDSDADTEVEDNTDDDVIILSAPPTPRMATTPQRLFRPVAASPVPATTPNEEPIARRTRSGTRAGQH